MISLPSVPKIVSEEGNRAVIEIENLYPGYGHTAGNALRRALLSSLKGAVVTAVKIDGVGHEFSTIEGVMEDVTDLTLNLKQLRFRLHEDGPFTISLSAGGEREITGKDFKMPSQAELVTPDVHIATLTSKKSHLGIEGTVEAGFGYVPVDEKTKEKVEVGTIALDAAFSPVRHVNYEVENMRVGDRTDYNRLRLVIETDGSLSPREAFTRASEILNDQFTALRGGFAEPEAHEFGAEEAQKTEDKALPLGKGAETDAAFKIKIDELKLSSRTLNVLREAGIKTVGGLSRKRTSTLGEVKGVGDKGIQEIKKALGNLGITLKP